MALGVPTGVANNDNSTDCGCEWSTGFERAMFAQFETLANTDDIPLVLSLSLGSLSYDSCQILCTQTPVVSNGQYSYNDCVNYMVSQRQVCRPYTVCLSACGLPLLTKR
jgi:hypothetical protein